MALERLENGFLVGIFPEGTRSPEGDMHAFRPGFLAIVRRTKQPIYPVGIAGAHQIMPRGARWVRPGRVEIVIGDPLTEVDLKEFHENADPGALCELAQSRVMICATEALENLSCRKSNLKSDELR